MQTRLKVNLSFFKKAAFLKYGNAALKLFTLAYIFAIKFKEGKKSELSFKVSSNFDRAWLTSPIFKYSFAFLYRISIKNFELDLIKFIAISTLKYKL